MTSRLITILLLCAACGLKSQNRLTDSLIALTQKPGVHDTVKLKLYGDISWELLTNDVQLSLHYAQKELALSVKTGRKADIAQSESDIGNIYNHKAVYDTALIHYNKALALRQELKQDEKVAGIYVNVATVMMRQTKFKAALEMDFKSLALFEKTGNVAKQAVLMGNIGNIYNQLGQKQMALSFFLKGLALSRSAGLTLMEGNILTNIGGLHFSQAVKDTITLNPAELDSALYYFLEAEKVLAKKNAVYNIAAVHNDIGKIYAQKGEDRRALDYYLRSLESRKTLDDRFGVGLSSMSIGGIYLKLKDFDKSKSYLKSSEAIFKELNNLVNLREVYLRLSRVYRANNNYDSSLVCYGLYAGINEQIYTRDNAEQMAEMQTRYESQKKDLEIARQQAELETREKQVLMRNSVIVAVCVGALLLVLAGYVFYRKRQYDQKARLDAEMAIQKDLRAKAIIEAEEKERIRIAKDLHDGVGQLLSAAKMNLSSMQASLKLENKDEEIIFKNALDLLDESVKEVRTVSHNMMPNTLLKMGLGSAVKEFVTRIQNTPNLKVNLEIVGLTDRLGQEKESILYRVIQEVVSNIIKHAKASELGLQLVKHESEITIMIEDNGIGFDASNIDAFNGIGLKNISSRVEFMNGSVHFDSAPGKGTRVIIDVPL